MILYGGWTTLGIVLGGSLIVFLIGTVIGMVTSRAVMKENALIDGLINAVTAIPPIAYPHAISLQALEDFQSYSDAVNAFSTSADPEVVQSAIATALNVSNDNVIDLPISYSKDLVVYNSSKIAGYTFSSVPQFFEIDNVQPAE